MSSKHGSSRVHRSTKIPENVTKCKLPENPTLVQYLQFIKKVIAEVENVPYIAEVLRTNKRIDIRAILFARCKARFREEVSALQEQLWNAGANESDSDSSINSEFDELYRDDDSHGRQDEVPSDHRPSQRSDTQVRSPSGGRLPVKLKPAAAAASGNPEMENMKLALQQSEERRRLAEEKHEELYNLVQKMVKDRPFSYNPIAAGDIVSAGIHEEEFLDQELQPEQEKQTEEMRFNNNGKEDEDDDLLGDKSGFRTANQSPLFNAKGSSPSQGRRPNEDIFSIFQRRKVKLPPPERVPSNNDRSKSKPSQKSLAASLGHRVDNFDRAFLRESLNLLTGDEHAAQMVKDLNADVLVEQQLLDMCLRAFINAMFGTGSPSASSKTAQHDGTMLHSSTIKSLRQFMGSQRYDQSHGNCELHILMQELKRMIMTASKAQVAPDNLYYHWLSEFTRHTHASIRTDKSKLANFLNHLEEYASGYVDRLESLPDISKYIVDPPSLHVDRMISNALLQVVEQDTHFYNFHKPYVYQSEPLPAGGYYSLKAKLVDFLVQTHKETEYGFAAIGKPSREHDKSKSHGNSRGTQQGYDAAVNAVSTQQPSNTKIKKPGVNLCPFCFCSGKAKAARSHRLSKCSNVKAPMTFSQVSQQFGEDSIADWKAKLKELEANDKGQSKSQGKDSGKSASKPTGKPTSKSPSTKDNQTSKTIAFIATEIASDSEESYDPAYSINAVRIMAKVFMIAGEEYIMDPDGNLVPVKSLVLYDGGSTMHMFVVDDTNQDGTMTVTRLKDMKTMKIKTALGRLDSCRVGYSPLLGDKVLVHEGLRCDIFSEARARIKRNHIQYQHTDPIINPCPEYVDVTIDGITIRFYRYSDGLLYAPRKYFLRKLAARELTPKANAITRAAARGQPNPAAEVSPTFNKRGQETSCTETNSSAKRPCPKSKPLTHGGLVEPSSAIAQPPFAHELDTTNGNVVSKRNSEIHAGNAEIDDSQNDSHDNSGNSILKRNGIESRPHTIQPESAESTNSQTENRQISSSGENFQNSPQHMLAAAPVAPAAQAAAGGAVPLPSQPIQQVQDVQEGAQVVDDSHDDPADPSYESEGDVTRPPPEPPPHHAPHNSDYITRGTAAGYAKAGLNASLLKLKQTVQSLHYALGCTPYKTIAKMIDQGKLVHKALTGKLVMHLAGIIGPCDHCGEGKAKQPAQRANEFDQSVETLATGLHNMCMDIMFTKSEHRASHPALLCVLELHNFVNLTYLNSRSTKDVQTGLDKILMFFEKYGHKVEVIKCDREGAFVELAKQKYKIDLTAGVGYHQALAEVLIQIIQKIFMCILKRLPFTLPRSFHPRLAEYSCLVHNNRLAKGASVTPQEAVMNIKPTIEELIKGQFGRIAMWTIPEKERNLRKTMSFGNDITEIGIVVGFEPRTPANLKVWLPFLGKTVSGYHIVTRKDGEQVTNTEEVIKLVNSIAAEEERKFKLSSSKKKASGQPVQRNQIDHVQHTETQVVNTVNSYSSVVGDHQHIPGSRSIIIDAKQHILPPDAFDHISIKKLRKFLPHHIIDAAVLDELKGNMEGRNVWKYVPWSEVSGKHILRSHFFLKVKEVDGLFDKLKGRMVCDGSNQLESEYSRTSSPTVDYSSILLQLSLVKYLKAKLATVDIPGAFLNSKLKEKIYMLLDVDIAEILVRNNPDLKKFQNKKGQLVVLLLMCLYGLKQAGAEWFEVISSVIIGLGYTQSKADRCVFFKRTGDKLDMIAIHVDDCLIMYTNETDYIKLKEKFVEVFGEMQFKEGNDHNYLGLKIKVLKDRSVFINQSSYTKKVLKTYVDWRTTMDPGFKLRVYSTPSVADMMQDMRCDKVCDKLFQESVIHYVYSLSYLAQRTRPDTLFPVNIMATVVSCPPVSIIRHLDRVFGYLSGTLEKGILLGANNTTTSSMADAAYGIHWDGKSHTGLFVFLDHSLLSAKSSKQKLVTVSSTEAELESLTEAIKVQQPIHKLLEELKLLSGKPTTMYQDNKSTMRIASRGEGYDGKSRHMRVRYHYIAEQVENGTIDIQHLETTKMVADLLSKPGGGSNFAALVKTIVKDMPDI